MRNTDEDYANRTKFGDRVDNRNLIDEWRGKMEKEKLKHKFIWNIGQFNSLKFDQDYDHILG